jgi:hypothetical protein
VGDGGVRLQSRHGRDLTRYFPDLSATLAAHLPAGVVLDGKILIWDDDAGQTSFTLLQQRFTAGRRITAEAAAHPAHFVSFDLLQDARGPGAARPAVTGAPPPAAAVAAIGAGAAAGVPAHRRPAAR